MAPALYKDTQLVDTTHLIAILMEHCDKVGMSYHAHRDMAKRLHPDGAHFSTISVRASVKNVDVVFGRTAILWIKVFGWSFVVHLEGREYPIESSDDFRNVIVEYLDRHDMLIHHLEKKILKGKGGWSISRLYYQTIKHIQLNTAIRAVEGLGGYVALRRPKKR